MYVSELGPEHFYARIDLMNHTDDMHRIGSAGGHKESPLEALKEALEGVDEWVQLTRFCFDALMGSNRVEPKKTRERPLDSLVDDPKASLEDEIVAHAVTRRALEQCKNTLSATSRENEAMRESIRLTARQVVAMSESAEKWRRIVGDAK